MAADAKVDVKIDVDYVGKREVRSVLRDLNKIDRAARGMSSKTFIGAGAREGFQSLGKMTIRLRKHFDSFDKQIQMMGKIGLKGLSMALKVATFEMVAMGAAMLAVHGSFVIGNAAMKAMKSTLGPLAAGMAAVVASAAAASAAIREQQAAMYAYKTTTKGQFGSSLNQTRQVMRGLHSDTYLASVGIDNLNKAFGTISKNSTFTMKSQNLLKGLMDFASAGQPIEEGIQKAAELIGMLQDSKKSFAEAKTAAQELFPDQKALDKAFKELKITTKKGLEKAILSGDLAKASGVQGQFDAVSGTLISRLKGYFNIIRNQFADLGQPLLEPVKKSMYEIFNILRNGFVRISGSTKKFGMGSMLDGLVGMIQKLTDMSVKLINENVHTVDGMFDRMGRWWDRFRDGWDTVLNKLRPLIDGARVIEEAFGAAWKSIKNIAGSKFTEFNEWLQGNRSTVIEFGDRVGKLIESIFKFTGEFGKIMREMLPFINDIIGGLTQMLNLMTGFLQKTQSLTGGGAFGAMATYFGLRGMLSAAAKTQGGYVLGPGKPGQGRGGPRGGVGGGPGGVVGGGGPAVIYGGGALGTTGAAILDDTTPPRSPFPTGGPTVPTGPYMGGGGPGAPGGPGAATGADRGSASRMAIPRPEYEVFKRAPKGGVTIGDKFYRGGQFLPTSAITDIERGYFQIGDVTRSGRMSPMTEMMTPYGPVSVRASNIDGGEMRGAASRIWDGTDASRGMASRVTGSSGVMRGMMTGVDADAGTAGGGMGILPDGPSSDLSRSIPLHDGEREIQQKVRTGRFGKFYQKYFEADFMAPEDQAEYDRRRRVTKMNRTNKKGELTRRARMYRRSEQNRRNRERSRFGRGMSRFQGSSGARFGTTMALGMASQFAPEEAQGALALGAAVGQINPLLGLGVAGMGTAINAKTRTGGTVSGVAGGAALGAMVGSVVPVLGTAAGAVIGGILGGVTGFIMGGINKQKEKAKKAREAAKSGIQEVINISMSGIFSAMQSETGVGRSVTRNFFDRAISDLTKQKALTTGIDVKSGGYTQNLEQANLLIERLRKRGKENGFLMTDERLKDANEDPIEFAKTFMKENQAQLEATGIVQEKYNTRLDMLGKITGKTDQEIVNLAKSMNFNLMDPTKSLTEQVEALGLAVVKTAEQFNAATADSFAKPLKMFDDAFKKWDTPLILDEMAETFRETYQEQGGKTTARQRQEFVRGVMEQNLALYGGNGGLALAQTLRSFEEGTAFEKGGTLYGMRGDADKFKNDPLLKEIFAQQKRGVGSDIATQLNAVLNKGGKAVDATKFGSLFAGMNAKQIGRVSQLAASGFALDDEGLLRAQRVGKEQAILESIFGVGQIPKGFTLEEFTDPAVDLAKATKEMKTAVENLTKATSDVFKRDGTEKPDWFTVDAFRELVKALDTATPRGNIVGDTTSSRLAQTLGRHSAMDGMLTGKRTMISSYRTYGLGSINSDHVTGRAYDLVGQNLGQYQALVRSTGGFAEFHGVNGARHLHVVPGSGIGDTRVPVASSNSPQTLMVGTGGGSNTYHFHIQGTPNASPSEIAEQVIVRLKQIERSNKERS